MRYRQVHLDFHTSPHIEGIGEDFDAEHWQRTLTQAHVDSITLFATCHHGYAYTDLPSAERHPHLGFDLLAKQVEASHAVGIATPIYLTAGINNWAAERHPEWREIGSDGRYTGWSESPLEAGFHRVCFNSPYLDLLCEQIRDVVRKFPTANGIFLDIISQGDCCCKWCLATMREMGLDPLKDDDREIKREAVLLKYYEATTAAAKALRPDMPVFHNSGNVQRGRTDLLRHFSHLEIESLPTGGWGYDHFPLSARYTTLLPYDVIGMTGKFHTTWGEFGGYKHPNALRYECAAMLAHGTGCSVGDQLHPGGRLDESTYELIGTAYREVRAKEPFCRGSRPVADIGVISSIACNPRQERESQADNGVSRVLLESQLLFNVLEPTWDFSPYRLLILPDDIRVDDDLRRRIEAYLQQGGRLLLTGTSGLNAERDGCVFDLGATLHGPSPFEPDYVLPVEDLQADFCRSPLVMYLRASRLKAAAGTSLGQVYDPYFNRDFRHFSSHQHTPYRSEPSGFDLGVTHGPITYLAHPWFSIYAAYGAVAYRQVVHRAILRALDTPPTVEAKLPSTARMTLTHQPDESRYLLHLLHATPIQRGAAVKLQGGNAVASQPIQIIEDLLPLQDIQLKLHHLPAIQQATDTETGEVLNISTADASVELAVNKMICHKIISLDTNSA
jgi:hypothetical protein